MKIVFDCDDTLFGAMPEIYLTARRFANGNVPHYSQWQCGISQPWIEDIEEWKSFMIKDGVLERIQLLPGAKHLLYMLNEQGHEVHIMTNRGFHPNAEKITAYTLGYVPYTSLSVLPFDACKGETVVDLFGQVDVFVDDNIKHCRSVISYGAALQVFQPHLPNSSSDPSIKRIHDITELFDILKI